MKTCGVAVARTVLLCFQTCIATGAVLGFEDSPSLSLILAFVLTTSLCDTLEIYPERLIAPFWQELRGCHPTLAVDSAWPGPLSAQRLCILLRNAGDTYAAPEVRTCGSRGPPSLP